MNLNELSNEQRESHRQAVCRAIGLDPDPALGHLDYIWMEQESGPRSLVLYAKRGTTEMLRALNKISIQNLEQHDGPGYVSFKAVGVNGVGRQEMAVGSSSTEGLRGEKLAHSIMTASTRALRRLTLQFAGHGLLDESEVTSQLTNIAAPATSLAQLSGSGVVLPPPQVAPSATPGKDITPTPSQNETPTLTPQIVAIPEGIRCLDCKALLSDHVLVNSERICPSGAVEAAQQAATAEPKKRRGRKPRGQVDISSPGQVSASVETVPKSETPVQTAIPAGHIDASGQMSPVRPANEFPTGFPLHEVPSVSPIADIPQSQPSLTPVTSKDPIIVEAAKVMNTFPEALAFQVNEIARTQVSPAAPAQVNSAPTIDKAKQDEYKARLRKYSNEILPSGGMVPSESIGGTTMKLRKFASLQIGIEVPTFKEEHYEELFAFLDSYVAQHGPQALVAYIDKSLGVVK